MNNFEKARKEMLNLKRSAELFNFPIEYIEEQTKKISLKYGISIVVRHKDNGARKINMRGFMNE